MSSNRPRNCNVGPLGEEQGRRAPAGLGGTRGWGGAALQVLAGRTGDTWLVAGDGPMPGSTRHTGSGVGMT